MLVFYFPKVPLENKIHLGYEQIQSPRNHVT